MEPLIESPGKSVGSDFNGDGIHDVIAGASLNNDTDTDAGAAYILYGAGALSSTYNLNGTGVNVTLLGKASDDRFGIFVASAGDVNSDGFDDVIAGANLNNDGGGGLDDGAAYVLYGNPSLAATIAMNGAGADVTIVGKAANDFLGTSVSGVGDINGDGFDDLIASARNNDVALDAGAAYILYGSASLSATYQLNGSGVSVTLLGKAESDFFGRSAAAGDINRDGFDDVITGAYYNNDGGSNNEGAAYILFGGSSLAATIRMDGVGANVTVLGIGATSLLGDRVFGAGDINGDGFDDTVIGASQAPAIPPGSGAAYVVYGRVGFADATIDIVNAENDLTVFGSAASDNLGAGANGAGDVNDDGFYDLILGANLVNDGATLDVGAAYIVFGGSSLETSINAGNGNVTIIGKAASDNLGRNVAGVGDVNNDGIADVMVSAHLNDDGPGGSADGAAYIIFGSESMSSEIRIAGAGPSVTILGKAASDNFGLSVNGGRGNPGP